MDNKYMNNNTNQYLLNEGIWLKITNWIGKKFKGNNIDEQQFANVLADLLKQTYQYNPAAFVVYNTYDMTFYPSESNTGSYSIVKLPEKKKYYITNPKRGINIEIPIFPKLDNIVKYISFLEKNKLTPEELQKMNVKKSQHNRMKQVLRTGTNITPALQEYNTRRLTKNYLKRLIDEVMLEQKQNKGKCPKSGCIQKKPNGKWGIISNKTGKWWNANYDSKKDAEAALRAYHVNK